MRKIFSTKYLTLILFLALGLVSLMLGRVAFAQSGDSTDFAKKYGVSFPVSELGGCKDYYECRTYCEDPINYDVCISYAKGKGFYKGETTGDEKLIAKARNGLGCSSLAGCREFCNKTENFDKCHKFAQSSGVEGGYKEDPTSKALLTQAKDFLSCNSYDSCKSFCDNPANRDRCAEFARKIGINGGYEYKGPGGCSTPESCKSFCFNPTNVEICKQFSSGYGGKFVGPGGCTDESSCKTYCERNPQACTASSAERDYFDPQIMCGKTPSCKWENNGCKCGYYQETEKNYDPAGKCREYGCNWNGNYCSCTANDSTYLEQQKAMCLKYPTCNWTGSSCNCSQTNINYSTDPATLCTKYSGCAWSGTSCQCSSANTYYTGNSMTREQQETTCKAGGGTCQWNNDICSCQGYTSTSTSGGGSSSTATPTSTYYPTYSSTPHATATATPTTAATATPSSSSSSTSDGSFCNDSDGGSYDSAGTCSDASGSHSDYCEGGIARDWYCGGSWNGSSWTNRHCETGGYDCVSGGKQCSGGGCVSVQGAKTKSLLQSILEMIGL